MTTPPKNFTDHLKDNSDCVVIPSHVTADKLRAYTILDNSSMGEWDWQALQLEWNTAQLDDWGIDLPDFAPPCMDALSLQKSSCYRADFVAYMSSKSNSPFGTF